MEELTQTALGTPLPTSPSAGDERSGLLWGTGAYLFWGFVTIYWKGLKGFNAFEVIGYRVTSSALVMTIGLRTTGRLRPLLRKLSDRQTLQRVILSSLVLTANWTVYVWAVVHGHVLETALGYFITPIGLMMAGVMLMHERLRNVQKLVLVFAIASVIVLTIGYGKFPWISLVIALTWVTYSVTKKRSTLNAFESLTAETLVVVVPSIGLVVWGATRATSIPHLADTFHWALVGFTGVVTAIPLLMFAAAAQRIKLTMMALVQYIVPTINFFLGWLLYHESLTTTRVIGFVLVWIGLAIVSFDSLRRIEGSGTVG